MTFEVIKSVLSLVESGLHISSVSGIVGSIANIVESLEKNYSQDKDAKNAAIDTVIQILTKYKDPV